MDWSLIFDTTARAFVGVDACYFALAAVGLNVHFGYAGLVNFGQVGFLLIGAYGTAVSADAGASLLVAVLVGVLCSIGLALLLGIPTLRLRADYLAIVTIAASEILRVGVSARQLEGLTGDAIAEMLEVPLKDAPKAGDRFRVPTRQFGAFVLKIDR